MSIKLSVSAVLLAAAMAHDSSGGRDPYDRFSKNFNDDRHLLVVLPHGGDRESAVIKRNFRDDRHLHVSIPHGDSVSVQ